MADKPVCPVEDCALPVDIILRSSDGCLIGTHKANLAEFSEGFPTPESVTHSESDCPVHLVEDGKTLETLVQFMHKHHLPDLPEYRSIFQDPTALLVLAEAAEKYMVYSAMVVCKIRIASLVHQFPLECLAYAMKFNYPDIADAAAPRTLSKNVEDVIKHLGPANQGAVLPWVRYREQYLSIAEQMIKEPDRRIRLGGQFCADPTGHWHRFAKAVLSELPHSPIDLVQRLLRVDSLFNSSPLDDPVKRNMHILDGCPRDVCKAVAAAWVERCAGQLKGAGEFRTFLVTT